GPYLDQCADLLDGHELVRGRMGEEIERASEALARARHARVALVSSGDAGVHGMAARTLALAAGLDVEVEVIPGVTAALAAGAPLGAPRAAERAARRRGAAPRRAPRRRLGDAVAVGSAGAVGRRRAPAIGRRRRRPRFGL